jgi:peroxiredoxin family protein
MENAKDGVTLVVMSGDMDKAIAALNIAIGAAAMGKETNIFFTFWGVKLIQNGKLTGKSFFGKMMGLLNRGGITVIGPSRFNFGGVGRWMFNQMMKAHKITPMTELLQTAIDLGVKLWPCQMSMEVMEIGKEHFIPAAQPACGVATMLEMAYRSKVTLFI